MEVEVDCMRYFGIKSYLKHFYERQSRNGNLHQLCLTSSPRPRFSSRWWKIPLGFGSFLVLFGFCLLIMSYFLPRKKLIVDSNLLNNNSQMFIIDRQAITYNKNVDYAHLLGIYLVVAGGILFSLSLLTPTFFYMWFSNEDLNDEKDSIKLRMKLSGDEEIFPVGNVLKSIQPNYYQN